MTRDRNSILWDDEYRCAYPPGANGALEYGRAREVLGSTWRLACFVETDAVVFEEGGLHGWRSRAAMDSGPPHDAEIIPGGWDHEHCCLVFCGASVHCNGEPEEAEGLFSTELDCWMCRTCFASVEKWRAALLEGLAAKGW